MVWFLSVSGSRVCPSNPGPRTLQAFPGSHECSAPSGGSPLSTPVVHQLPSHVSGSLSQGQFEGGCSLRSAPTCPADFTAPGFISHPSISSYTCSYSPFLAVPKTGKAQKHRFLFYFFHFFFLVQEDHCGVPVAYEWEGPGNVWKAQPVT